MNVHKNARLTLIGRARLVKRVLEQGDTPSAAAAAEGVSVRTTFKWLARYRAEGHAGLSDRCSRPRRVRSALSARQRERVAQLRRQRRPYREIARLVGGSLSAVARYARALGLNRLSALEPKAPIVRYERARPGELVHLDTKRLARFWRPGHRVTADPSVYSDGAGYQFLHVAIDDHARVAYCELHARERASDAVRFLKGLLTYYRRLGIRVARLLTDNGSCYRAKRFARACERLGIKHSFTRAYRPQTNGKAERFIKTALTEWAYVRTYQHWRERAKELPPWLHRYNWHRPHASLGYRPPISRLGLSMNNLSALHS
jgi:transposase InsO family protein